MRLTAPRIPPVDPANLTDEQREVLHSYEGRRPVVPNIVTTLAHTPKGLKAFLGWSFYVLSANNSLPARQREIVTLRVAYRCRSGYEFTHHAHVGLDAGLTEDEISKVKDGPGSDWAADDAALIRATDELVSDHFISEATWQELNDHFDQRQCMDVVLTAGQYTQVSMMLNTFGVQMEDGLEVDADFKP